MRRGSIGWEIWRGGRSMRRNGGRATGRRRVTGACRTFRLAAVAHIRLTRICAQRPSSTELLLTVAEPTRLRILNCLAAAPLFVSDLQAVLGLPQPTVSRHLQVLRRAGAGAGHADRAVRALPPAPRPRRAGPAALGHPRRGGARRRDDARRARPRRRAQPLAHQDPGAQKHRHDPPHSRRRRRARHHRARRLPSRQGRLPGLHRRTTAPTRSRRRGRSGPTSSSSTSCCPGVSGYDVLAELRAAGGDPRRRRHPAHRAARGDRPHPRPLARRRRLPHQAVLPAGALAPGARRCSGGSARRR